MISLFRSKIAVVTAIAMSIAACSKKDTIYKVAEDDPEMIAAIEQARLSLPTFWEVFEKPEKGEDNFSLKVKITDQHGTEHFWAIDLRRQDGKTTGVINNDPGIVAGVKLGDRIDITDEAISDWLYLRDRKMVGNYTVRPLLKKMPAAKAEALKRILADP